MFHFLSRVGLKIAPPAVVYRLLGLVGRIAPLTRDEGVTYFNKLDRVGSCLSRSISVASRLPEAYVAIGVTPLPERTVCDAKTIHAHAWVEIGGEPLRGREPMGAVIGTLGRRRGG